jgi:paraquat-inducible protein A
MGGLLDVFLVALYIKVIKGVGFGCIEIAWGLYHFTFCVITSLVIQFFSVRKL